MSNFNWCHGPECHKKHTVDRVRGVKGSKVLRTRKIKLVLIGKAVDNGVTFVVIIVKRFLENLCNSNRSHCTKDRGS
jgi:hypothetical protein